MTKAELVNAVVLKTGLTRAEATAATTAVFDIISDALGKRERVNIRGFGEFNVRYRPERVVCNPVTREPMRIAAGYFPAFKAGKTLKNAVTY